MKWKALWHTAGKPVVYPADHQGSALLDDDHVGGERHVDRLAACAEHPAGSYPVLCRFQLLSLAPPLGLSSKVALAMAHFEIIDPESHIAALVADKGWKAFEPSFRLPVEPLIRIRSEYDCKPLSCVPLHAPQSVKGQ